MNDTQHATAADAAAPGSGAVDVLTGIDPDRPVTVHTSTRPSLLMDVQVLAANRIGVTISRNCHGERAFLPWGSVEFIEQEPRTA